MRGALPWLVALGAILVASASHGDPAIPPSTSEPAKLVGILHDGAKTPSLIGSSGEIYRPEDSAAQLRWKRTAAGGVSRDIEAVFQDDDGALYALGRRAPMFERQAGIWSVHPLHNRGRTAVSRGGAKAVAIGRHIYLLSKGGWSRVASAKSDIIALWSADGRQFYIATDKGELAVGRGRSFQNISIALAGDESVSELFGAQGNIVLRTSQERVFRIRGKQALALALPKDSPSLHFDTFGAAAGQLYAVARFGDEGHEESRLYRLEGDALVIDAELWPLADEDRFAIVGDDGRGQLFVASYHGQIRVREAGGAWRNGQLVSSLPQPPTGSEKSGPARAGP